MKPPRIPESLEVFSENISRTIDGLKDSGHVVEDEEGVISLTPEGKERALEERKKAFYGAYLVFTMFALEHGLIEDDVQDEGDTALVFMGWLADNFSEYGFI